MALLVLVLQAKTFLIFAIFKIQFLTSPNYIETVPRVHLDLFDALNLAVASVWP